MGRTNETLWKRVVAEVKRGSKGGAAGQWSARKAQLATQTYKRRGGSYSGRKTSAQRSLTRWTAQKWTTSDGKPARGRKGGTARYLPASAWRKLSPSQRRATNAKKKAGSKSGSQFVSNTRAAKSASKRIRWS